MKKKTRASLLIFAALLTVTALFSGCTPKVQEDPSGPTVEEMLGQDVKIVHIDGKAYAENREVDTYLVMGVDRSGEVEAASAMEGGGQADMLMVLVVNHETEEYHVIQINRDTMTDVTVLGTYGDEIGTERMQIAAAHSYGTGLEDSCENTVKAVSNFLYGIEIDKYAAIQMDAIPLINDWAGGVTVTIQDDFSQVDPTLVMGETITLNGEQAYHFVRGRFYVGDSTNINRMARQRQYFDGLATQVHKKVAEDLNAVAQLYQELTPYMVTDMGSGTMTKLAQTCNNYTNGGIVTIEGESKVGEEFMEFYADDNSVKQVILDLFYTQVQEETE